MFLADYFCYRTCAGCELTMQPRCWVLLLFFAGLASSQRPKIKVGATIARCGPQAELSISQENSWRWLANYTSSRGGVDVNGTAHDVELILYVPLPVFLTLSDTMMRRMLHLPVRTSVDIITDSTTQQSYMSGLQS